jgi:hypothetical protein
MIEQHSTPSDPHREGIEGETGFDEIYANYVPFDPQVDSIDRSRPRTAEEAELLKHAVERSASRMVRNPYQIITPDEEVVVSYYEARHGGPW